MSLRAIELFCGIGGFAAAVAGNPLRVVAAFDQNSQALQVYRLNHPLHEIRNRDLERVSAWELSATEADLWWLSPPCQPYCERGNRRDVEDPRARSLLHVLDLLGRMPDGRLPQYLALENVLGFAQSQAHRLLLATLKDRGYSLREFALCPTELGIPSRRPRYYLAASRSPLLPVSLPSVPDPPPLRAFLESDPGELLQELLLPPQVLERFGRGLRILDPSDDRAYTTCFTSGYGKSIVNAGSYLRHCNGARRFTPLEIARMLGFPPTFRFPDHMPLRKQWHLVGNSLSVAAVRHVLMSFPRLAG